uniref:Uncharacterized protein n=1 Tax=Knipowitschia caucasica TaxID=637954 RepID=A0AAV2J5X8_KNICA
MMRDDLGEGRPSGGIRPDLKKGVGRHSGGLYPRGVTWAWGWDWWGWGVGSGGEYETGRCAGHVLQITRVVAVANANAYQVLELYMLEGLSRWNMARAKEAVAVEGASALRSFDVRLMSHLNSLSQRVLGCALVPEFTPPGKPTDERTAVEYLLGQTNRGDLLAPAPAPENPSQTSQCDSRGVVGWESVDALAAYLVGLNRTTTALSAKEEADIVLLLELEVSEREEQEVSVVGRSTGRMERWEWSHIISPCTRCEQDTLRYNHTEPTTRQQPPPPHRAHNTATTTSTALSPQHANNHLHRTKPTTRQQPPPPHVATNTATTTSTALSPQHGNNHLHHTKPTTRQQPPPPHRAHNTPTTTSTALSPQHANNHLPRTEPTTRQQPPLPH